MCLCTSLLFFCRVTFQPKNDAPKYFEILSSFALIKRGVIRVRQRNGKLPFHSIEKLFANGLSHLTNRAQLFDGHFALHLLCLFRWLILPGAEYLPEKNILVFCVVNQDVFFFENAFMLDHDALLKMITQK